MVTPLPTAEHLKLVMRHENLYGRMHPPNLSRAPVTVHTAATHRERPINDKVEMYNRCLADGGTSNCLALVTFWRILSNLSLAISPFVITPDAFEGVWESARWVAGPQDLRTPRGCRAWQAGYQATA